jgi:nitroreductase
MDTIEAILTTRAMRRYERSRPAPTPRDEAEAAIRAGSRSPQS